MKISLKFKLLRLKRMLKKCMQKSSYYQEISSNLLDIIDESLIDEIANDNKSIHMYIMLLNYNTYFIGRIHDINILLEEINSSNFKRLIMNKNTPESSLIDIKYNHGLNVCFEINKSGKLFEELFIHDHNE